MTAPTVTSNGASVKKPKGQKQAHSLEKSSEVPSKGDKRVKHVESSVSSTTGSKSTSSKGPVESNPNGATTATSSATEPPRLNGAERSTFTGTFDLYGINLPFLNSVYLPKGKSAVDPEALYKTILTYQAKSDLTAKFTISNDFASGGKEGNFESGVFRDPMEEMPFEIAATDIKEVDKLAFKSKYPRPDATQGAWSGSGIKASLEIDGGGGCGISSSGSISMHPLWRKVNTDGDALEIFEGTLTFRVKYGSMYSRKGHGSGQNQTIDFWAVRAKK